MIRLRLGDIVLRTLACWTATRSRSTSRRCRRVVARHPQAGGCRVLGSILRRGEAGALVYATGERTYFGKTAELVQNVHAVSHFQRAVLKIGNYLIILAVALVTVIVAISLLRGTRSSPPCSSLWS